MRQYKVYGETNAERNAIIMSCQQISRWGTSKVLKYYRHKY